MKKGIRGHYIRADGIENLSLLAIEYELKHILKNLENK